MTFKSRLPLDDDEQAGDVEVAIALHDALSDGFGLESLGVVLGQVKVDLHANEVDLVVGDSERDATDQVGLRTQDRDLEPEQVTAAAADLPELVVDGRGPTWRDDVDAARCHHRDPGGRSHGDTA